MDPISTWLINQGPAGIVALALVFVFRAKETQAREYQTELKALHEKHRAEMDVLIERHLIRSEKWADKGQALAEKLTRRRSRTMVGMGTEGDET